MVVCVITCTACWLMFQTHELGDVMYQAIVKNRVDFVQMFLENGVNPKDFLTIRRLLQLYNSVSG